MKDFLFLNKLGSVLIGYRAHWFPYILYDCFTEVGENHDLITTCDMLWSSFLKDWKFYFNVHVQRYILQRIKVIELWNMVYLKGLWILNISYADCWGLSLKTKKVSAHKLYWYKISRSQIWIFFGTKKKMNTSQVS